MERKNIRILAIAMLISGLILSLFGTFGDSLFTGSNTEITHSYFGDTSETQYLHYASIDFNPPRYAPLVIRPAWDEIDQQCYIDGDTAGFSVHYSPNWGMAYFLAEGLYNDREPLTGFQLLISWWDGNGEGTVDDYLYIGVSKTLSYNPDDWEIGGFVDYSKLEPRHKYWVGMDFSDDPIDISEGETFYLIAVTTDSLPDDLKDGGWWIVGGNYTTDVYDRGHLYYDNDADNNWDEMLNNGLPYGDLYFRTYTPDDGVPNQRPLVTITSSYWVATQILGMLMCISSLVMIVRYW